MNREKVLPSGMCERCAELNLIIARCRRIIKRSDDRELLQALMHWFQESAAEKIALHRPVQREEDHPCGASWLSWLF